MKTPRWFLPSAASILAAMAVVMAASARRLTLTYDEPAHYRYGLQILSRRTAERFADSTMPVTALNAIPRAAGWAFARLQTGGAARRLGRDPRAGRYVTMFAAVLLGAVVCRWANELYGPAAGLFSLALCAFEPEILAHGQLITTDLYAALAVTLALYCFRRFVERPGLGRAAAGAAALGLAQLAKHAALILYPVFVMILAVRHSRRLARVPRRGDFSGAARAAAAAAGWAIFFISVSSAVIAAGFLFEGAGRPLDAYDFRSSLGRALQARAGPLGRLPLPLPSPYLQGLDWSQRYEEDGGVSGNLYLFGRLRPKGSPFAGYYFYALLFKVPLAVQAALWAALAAYVVRRKRFDFRRDEVYLLAPAAAAAVWFGLFFKAQVGVRYVLFALPPLLVFCGSLLEGWEGFGPWRRAALLLLPLWQAASVLSWYPHFLPYFNELIMDRTRCYRVLADSNIDWGQGEWYLRRYMKAHPGAVVNPGGPTAGRVLVGVNLLTGVFQPERYRWLRENFEPVGSVAHTYLVYEIPPSALARIARGEGGGATPAPVSRAPRSTAPGGRPPR